MSLWIEKAGPVTKVYVKPGQKVAPGTKLYKGPHGGVYYIPSEKPEKPQEETAPSSQGAVPDEEKSPLIVEGWDVPRERNWEFYPFVKQAPPQFLDRFHWNLENLIYSVGLAEKGMDYPRLYDGQDNFDKVYLWESTYFRDFIFDPNVGLPYDWVLKVIIDKGVSLGGGMTPSTAWRVFITEWFDLAQRHLIQKYKEIDPESPMPNILSGDTQSERTPDPILRKEALQRALYDLMVKNSPEGQSTYTTPWNIADYATADIVEKDDYAKAEFSPKWKYDWAKVATLINYQSSGSLISKEEDFIKKYDDGDPDHSWAHPHYRYVGEDKHLVETAEEIRKWSEAHPSADPRYDTLDSLPKNVKAAISDYSGSGFNYMKAALRQDGRYWDGERKISSFEMARAQKYVMAIDALMERVTIEEDRPILHGVASLKSLGVEDDSKLAPGDILIDPSFTSWSLDPWTSFEFTARGNYAHGKVKPETPGNPEGLPVVLSIVNPNGLHGIYLGGSEWEYILPHGMRYKVTKIEDVNVAPNARYNVPLPTGGNFHTKWRVITVEPVDPDDLEGVPWWDHEIDCRSEKKNIKERGKLSQKVEFPHYRERIEEEGIHYNNYTWNLASDLWTLKNMHPDESIWGPIAKIKTEIYTTFSDMLDEKEINKVLQDVLDVYRDKFVEGDASLQKAIVYPGDVRKVTYRT